MIKGSNLANNARVWQASDFFEYISPTQMIFSKRYLGLVIPEAMAYCDRRFEFGECCHD
jgi:hypothetical protein